MFNNVQMKKTHFAILRFMVIGLLGGAIISKVHSAPPSSAATSDPLIYFRPEQQAQFIEVVQSAQAAVIKAENDMQKGGAKANRDKQICAILKSPQIKDWTGTLTEINANSDGKGVLTITIAKNIQIKTWNNALSDIADQTLIEPGNNLFNKVSVLKKGSKVRFSGSFIYESSDCIRESSLTLNGKLKDPGFIFKFMDVALLDSVPTQVSVTASQPAASPAPLVSSNASLLTSTDSSQSVTPQLSQSTTSDSTDVIKPSFDCAKASNTIEKMICVSPQLAKLDVQLADAYKAARANTSNQDLLKSEQLEWIKMSRKCPDEACLADFYKARINQLLR